MKRIIALSLLLAATLLSACGRGTADSSMTTAAHSTTQTEPSEITRRTEATESTHDRYNGSDGRIDSSEEATQRASNGIDYGGLEPPGSVTQSEGTDRSRITRRR